MLPGTINEITELVDRYPALKFIDPPDFIAYPLALCLICFAFITLLSRKIAQSPFLAHRRPHKAKQDYPYYTAALRENLPLLGLSTREFAERAKVSLWEAWLLINNPDVIPHQELLKPISETLILPEDFFEKGWDRNPIYGKNCVIDRCRWYDGRGISHVYQLAGKKYDKVPPRRLANILHNLEGQRRAELSISFIRRMLK